LSTVFLDGYENESRIANKLIDRLKDKKVSYDYFRMKDYNILPCRSCGSCGVKTPGRCVLKDDFSIIMKSVARCRNIVLLTPIRFGGYSATLKKIIDRFMLIGKPLYIVKEGHLLHPMRYGIKRLVGIGGMDNKSIEQQKCFELLLERNAINMQLDLKTLIHNEAIMRLLMMN